MNSLSRKSILGGTLVAALAVALGAFGAHYMRARLEAHYLEVFETGVRYQMYHAFALIFFGLVAQVKPMSKYIPLFFMLGIIFFCLSLYGLVLGSLQAENPVRWLGAITPIGGTCFIVAWILFAISVLKK